MFMYLFRGGETPKGTTQEDMEAHMGRWVEWMQGLSHDGVDATGEPLKMDLCKVIAKGGEVISDGPFAEGNEIVGGYVVFSASSLEEAVEKSINCPIFEYDGTVEVREIIPFEM